MCHTFGDDRRVNPAHGVEGEEEGPCYHSRGRLKPLAPSVHTRAVETGVTPRLRLGHDCGTKFLDLKIHNRG